MVLAFVFFAQLRDGFFDRAGLVGHEAEHFAAFFGGAVFEELGPAAQARALGPDIVQEFVEGSPLRASMPDNNTASLFMVVDTIQLIAYALEELAAAGIVHRDLKPENVILTADTRTPVLVDFGLAHVPTRKGAATLGHG